MNNDLLKATVIKDGRKIEVYKLTKGGFCNFNGCTEEFKKEELKFV